MSSTQAPGRVPWCGRVVTEQLAGVAQKRALRDSVDTQILRQSAPEVGFDRDDGPAIVDLERYDVGRNRFEAELAVLVAVVENRESESVCPLTLGTADHLCDPRSAGDANAHRTGGPHFDERRRRLSPNRC